MIDPEAGIESNVGDPIPFGTTSASSGEGISGFSYQDSRRFIDQFNSRTQRHPQSAFYEQIGSALQAQQQADQLQQMGSLLGGAYNPNWLAQQESAGSAEGQHL